MVDNGFEPKVLSPEALDRIGASLPEDITISRSRLDQAAHTYLEAQARVDAGTGRGFKADLKAMHRELARAVQVVSKARWEIILRLDAWGGEGTIPRFFALRRELESFEKTLAHAVARPMPRMHKSHPWYLLFSIDLLISAYDRAGGVRATHSLHDNGEYVGEPLSRFGKFVVAFFAEIDPTLSKRTLGSAIRKQFAELRREARDTKAG